MNFKEIFETLINIYGDGGLIISVLIVVLFIVTPYFFNKSNKTINQGLEKMASEIATSIAKQNENLINSLSNNESKMLDNQMKILEMMLKHSKQEHNEKIDKREAISIPIQEKINHLKIYYNCTRVAVLEFHNSKENLNGLPFKWYDMIYESQIKTADSISHDAQNLPANTLLPIIQDLKQNNIVILDHEKIASDIFSKSPVLYDHLINKVNANTVIYVPLRNLNDKLIGLLVLEYSGQTKFFKETFNSEELFIVAYAISALLELN